MGYRLFNCTTGELEIVGNEPMFFTVAGKGHSGWYMNPANACDVTHIDWDITEKGNLKCLACGAIAERESGREGAWWTDTNILWYMLQHPDQVYDESLAADKARAEEIAARWSN